MTCISIIADLLPALPPPQPSAMYNLDSVFIWTEIRAEQHQQGSGKGRLHKWLIYIGSPMYLSGFIIISALLFLPLHCQPGQVAEEGA